MTDLTIYRFETHQGMPPDGEKGQFFGFDAKGWAYILRWVDHRGAEACWVAVGFDPAPYLRDGTPVVIACREDRSGHIVRWAHAPWAEPEASQWESKHHA